MSTLPATRIISVYARMGAHEAPRLRGLFGRMAVASRAAETRRALSGLSERMLNDIGLTSGDLDHL